MSASPQSATCAGAILLSLMVAFVLPVWSSDVDQSRVQVRDGQFVVGDRPYRALGFTAYELCIGKDARRNSRERVEMIFRSARENGFTLYRATTVIYDFKTGELERHLSEPVWRQIDLILDVARSLGMRVIIDFSTMTYDTGRYSNPPFDVTARDNFPRLQPIYERVATRVNTINGIPYRDDPTIMAYSILGEIVPYGLVRTATGDIDLHNESRDAQQYIEFVAQAAAELKRHAPKTLVNAGGLLHVAPDGPARNAAGEPYWKRLWRDPNLDFTSLHIYAKPPKALPRPVSPPYTEAPMPWGAWRDLPTYVAFSTSIGKPFMMEEWGIDPDARGKPGPDGEPAPAEMSWAAVNEYVLTGFACMTQARVPVSITWQWSPGGHFNLWPGESPEEDDLIDLIRTQTRWFTTR